MILRTDLAPTVWRGSDGLTVQVRGYSDAKPKPGVMLRLLARKDDSERIAAVARALGLEAGSGAVGDVPDERCVDEEVKRILREHSERFLERQHAQEEDTES